MPSHSDGIAQHAFELAGDGLRALLPPELGEWRARAHRYGIKVWFGSANKPTREHYEAQVLGARHVPEATVLAIEVGFHAENSKVEDNDAVLSRLASKEKAWRKALGREPVAGPFIGRPDDWRRLSETWIDPDLGDPDLALDMASRLCDYMTALEPILRG